MRKRVVGIYIFLLAVVLASTLVLYFSTGKAPDGNEKEQLVQINEIDKLLEDGDEAGAKEKLAALSEEIRGEKTEEKRDARILLVGGIALISLLVVGIFMYISILRPLKKISVYASEIAKGNTDIPLKYERGSEVGEFAWAFDSMRKEVKKARASEKEAIENNKTVIATLSHDIKTPITSIRAYAEGLEANLDSSPEKRAQYLQVLMKKSDEVSKVTDDLLLHSLSDMHRLKVEPKDIDLPEFLRGAVRDLDPEGKDVVLLPSEVQATVSADPDRLLQCFENLISNAGKYADGKVEVALEAQPEERVAILVKDHGKGIPDEDMPFIFDKFYRGHNHGSNPGSGLGLYIVKYLMTQMDGDVTLRNMPDGLCARLILPVKTSEGLRTS